MLDVDELVPGLVDGGVLGVVALELDEGGVAGAMLEELDELVSGAGVVVVDEEDEPEGDGVTTGGVFGDVDGVDDSRLQPATPSTSPAQNSVTTAVFIEISENVEKGMPAGVLADSMPWRPRFGPNASQKMRSEISAVVNRRRSFLSANPHEAPASDAQISSAAGNNYPQWPTGRRREAIHAQIHAHGLSRVIGTLLAPRSASFFPSDEQQCRMP